MAWCNDTTQIVCCAGATCLNVKRCRCTCLGGTQSPVATCDVGSCQDAPFAVERCRTLNYCQCAALGRDWISVTAVRPTPCDCRRAFYACRPRDCTACSQETGQCVSTCPSPRQCCEWQNLRGATCCPITQRCQGYDCVDKCTAPTRYCDKPGSFWGYECCGENQDCCPGGCVGRTTTTLAVNVASDSWSASMSVTAGQHVTITATASGGANNSPGSTVSWAGFGSESTPDGVGLCCPGCNVDDNVGHMVLIGRINGGAPFVVGSSAAFEISATGTLEFRQNDTCTGDNQGSYTLQVTVRGCNPAVATAIPEAITYEATAQAGDSVPPPPRGPGTELKALLRYVGIVATPNCSCNQRAAYMDEMEAKEPGWCLAHMEEILGWLQEQAQERKLPFLRSAAKLLVKRAISNAKRKSSDRGNNQ